MAETIKKALPEVIKAMDVNIPLLAFLYSRDALTRDEKQVIMAEKTDAAKVNLLMDHILMDVKNKYEPLLEALKYTEQNNVVTMLQEASCRPPSEKYYLAFSKCINKLKAAYGRISARFSVFKNHPKLRHYTVNMTNTFTKLRLLEGFDNESIGTQVTMEQALNCGSKNFVMVGAPGSGKSSCILNAADLWGRTSEYEDPSAEPRVRNPFPAYIKQVIHISPQDCKSSLDETGKSVLSNWCGDQSPVAVDHYLQCPEETAVLVDSLDEVASNEGLIQDFFKTMNNGKSLMVVGCRSNHPLLDKIQCDHKLIQVDGFDESHVKIYIEKYFENGGKHGQDIVRRFKQAIDEDSKLAVIVRNPLVLSLICILLEAGKYEIDDLNSVKKIDIFNKITELVLEREKITDTSDLELYYKFSFLRLVDGGRFFEEDMKSFGIKEPKTLPFVSCDDAELDETRRGHRMVLPHRSFTEYAGAKYILSCDQRTRECLLMVLAGRREFNHVLNLLVELMHLDNMTAEHICKIILATQPEQLNPWHFSLQCTKSKNKKIKSKFIKLKMNTILDGISQVIHYQLKDIKPCHECWRKANYISTNEGRAVFHNALTAIQSIQDEAERAEVFTSALLPLFPQGIEGGHLVKAVPKTDRCISLKVVHPKVKVYSNRPSDVTNSDILNNLPDAQSLECLELHTNMKGILYSEEENRTDENDWKGLFQKLNNHCINSISFNPGDDKNTLLRELFSNIRGCHIKGVKRFMIENRHLIQAVPETDHWIALILKDELDTSSLDKIPSDLKSSNIFTCLYETEKKGKFKLYIHQHNAEHSLREMDWKQLWLSLSDLAGMNNINYVMVKHVSDCSNLLMALVSTLPGLSTKGVKRLIIESEKVDVSAILDFKVQLQKENWKFSDFDYGWTLCYGEERKKLKIEIKLNILKIISLSESELLECSKHPGTVSTVIRKIEDGHLVKAVPRSDRCVTLKIVDSNHVSMFSNRPSDVSSDILNGLSDVKTIKHLQLHTNMQGILYSEETYKSNENDWEGLFQGLSAIENITSVMLEDVPDCSNLLIDLASAVTGLSTKGVKMVTIKAQKVDFSAILNFKVQMEAEKWTVSDLDDDHNIYCEKIPEKIKMEIKLHGLETMSILEGNLLEAGKKWLHSQIIECLQLQVPGTTRHVRLYYGAICSDWPEDVIQTGAFSLYTGQERDVLVMVGASMVDGHHREVYTPSQEEWESFIDRLVKHEKIIKAGGRLWFTGYDNYDSLLTAISERVKQLGKYTQGGFIWLDIGKVTGGVLLSMMNNLSQDWEIGGENGMELYSKGGKGGRVLTLRLLYYYITYRSREEEDQLKKVTQGTGLLDDSTWK